MNRAGMSLRGSGISAGDRSQGKFRREISWGSGWEPLSWQFLHPDSARFPIHEWICEMTDTIENSLARKWPPTRGQLIKLVSVGLFATLGTVAVVQSILGEKKTPADSGQVSAGVEAESSTPPVQGLLGESSTVDQNFAATESGDEPSGQPPVVTASFKLGDGGSEPARSNQASPAPSTKLPELNLVGAERKGSSEMGLATSSPSIPVAVTKPNLSGPPPSGFPSPPAGQATQFSDSPGSGAPVPVSPGSSSPISSFSAPKPAEFKLGSSGGIPSSDAAANGETGLTNQSADRGTAASTLPPAASAGGPFNNDLRRPMETKLGAEPSGLNAQSVPPGEMPAAAGSLSSGAGGLPGPANSGLAGQPSPTGDTATPQSGVGRSLPLNNTAADNGGQSPLAAAAPGESRQGPGGAPTPPAMTFGPPSGSPLGSPIGSPPSGTGMPAMGAPPQPANSVAGGSGSTPSFTLGDPANGLGNSPGSAAAPPTTAFGSGSPVSNGSSTSPTTLPPGAGRSVGQGDGLGSGTSSGSPTGFNTGFDNRSGNNPAPPVATPPGLNRGTPSAPVAGLGSGSPLGSPGSPSGALGQNANLVRDGAGLAGALPGNGSGLPGKAELEGEQVPALSIEKVAPREIQIDQPTDFRVIVKNVGRVVANEVRVTDQVPRGAQFVKAVPEATRNAAGTLVWELGSLKPGEERSVVLTLQPKQTGEIGSVAQVTFAAPASLRVLVTKPQLAVEHSGPAKVMIGDRVPLAISVRNLGNGPAKEVVLQEVVPPQLKFSEDFNELEYEIGTLAPGESRKVNLNLSAAQIGRFRNTILVSGGGGLHAEHQIDMEVVAPQLQLSSEGPSRRYLKRNATHIFSVRNSGTAIATNLDLVTKLPQGVRFVSANNQGQYDPGSHAVYWSLDRLNVGQGASVQLTTTPEDPGEQAIEFIATADLNQKASFRQPLLVEDLLELFFEIDDVEDVIEVGSETRYRIRLINQGTVTATNLQLTFSAEQGIRPMSVDNRLAGEVRGQEVIFAPVAEIRPGQELVTYVTAVGAAPGEHRIVARLRSDQREMNVSKEESTRVYADR